MFGCFRTLGCLVVIVALAAAAWFTQDRWMPYVRGGNVTGAVGPAGAAGVVWQPVSDSAAAVGRERVQSLRGRSGPVFINLSSAQLASFVLSEVVQQLPSSARDVETAVIGDRVYLRTTVNLRDMGTDVLGPLGAMFGDRETLQLGGTLAVVRPGLGQFQVTEVKLRDFSLPPRVIPRLLERIRRAPPPEGVAADALPLDIPDYIGDVRVAGGKITLYKNVQ